MADIFDMLLQKKVGVSTTQGAFEPQSTIAPIVPQPIEQPAVQPQDIFSQLAAQAAPMEEARGIVRPDQKLYKTPEESQQALAELGGTAAEFAMGVPKGMTLGMFDPADMTYGMPFGIGDRQPIQIREPVPGEAPVPTAREVLQQTGTENPLAAGLGEFAGVIAPWEGLTKGFTLLGNIMRGKPLTQLQPVAAAGERAAATGLTGGTVSAAMSEIPEDTPKHFLVGAALGFAADLGISAYQQRVLVKRLRDIPDRGLTIQSDEQVLSAFKEAGIDMNSADFARRYPQYKEAAIQMRREVPGQPVRQPVRPVEPVPEPIVQPEPAAAAPDVSPEQTQTYLDNVQRQIQRALDSGVPAENNYIQGMAARVKGIQSGGFPLNKADLTRNFDETKVTELINQQAQAAEPITQWETARIDDLPVGTTAPDTYTKRLIEYQTFPGADTELYNQAQDTYTELTKAINQEGFDTNKVNAATAKNNPRVIELKKMLSELSGTTTRLTGQHLATLKGYKKSSPAKAQEAMDNLRIEIDKARGVLGLEPATFKPIEVLPSAVPAPVKPKPGKYTVDPEKDDILKAISKIGGLDKGEVAAQWGDAAIEFGAKKRQAFGKPILRVNNGLSIDRMIESLKEHGYLPAEADQNTLLEYLDKSVRGETVIAAESAMEGEIAALEADRPLPVTNTPAMNLEEGSTITALDPVTGQPDKFKVVSVTADEVILRDGRTVKLDTMMDDIGIIDIEPAPAPTPTTTEPQQQLDIAPTVQRFGKKPGTGEREFVSELDMQREMDVAADEAKQVPMDLEAPAPPPEVKPKPEPRLTRELTAKDFKRDPETNMWEAEVDGVKVAIYRDTEQFGDTVWHLDDELAKSSKLEDTMLGYTKKEAIETLNKRGKGTIKAPAPQAPSKGIAASVGGFAERQPVTPISQRQAIELPEMVQLVQDINQGKKPKVIERLRAAGGTALGQMRSVEGESADILLKADIFKDPDLATAVLGEEIGHLVDFLPDMTMKRGNILGSIQSVKKYAKTLVADLPENAELVLTTKDRRRIKSLANRQAKAIGLEPKTEDFNEYSRELYAELVATEIQERGLISKAEVTEELKSLSELWRPNAPEDYAFSPRELYANALSVMFNDPGLFREVAPTFSKLLDNYAGTKPEFWEAYNNIQNLQRDRSALITAQRERMRQGMKKAEKITLEQEQALSPYRRTGEKIAEALIDVNSPIYNVQKKIIRAGGDLSAEELPTNFIEEVPYAMSKGAAHWADMNDVIFAELDSLGIPRETFDELMFNLRVVHERGDLANPEGVTAPRAQEALDQIKSQLGDQEFNKLMKLADQFGAIRNTNWLQKSKELETFSPEFYEYAEANPYYTRFQTLEQLEKTANTSPGAISGTPGFQKGTLSSIQSPTTATMQGDMALMRFEAINQAREKTVDMLLKHRPDTIELAKTKRVGKTRQPVQPTDPDIGLVPVMKNGKVTWYNVPKEIADPLKFEYGESNIGLDVARRVNSIQRMLLTTHNPAFIFGSNFWRDAIRTVKNLPGVTARSYTKEYLGVIGEFFGGADSRGALLEEVRAMQSTGMILPKEIGRYGILLEQEPEQLSRMLRRYGIDKKDRPLGNYAGMGKAWDALEDVGYAVEILPKLTAKRLLEKQGKSEKYIASRVRNVVGTPGIRSSKADKWMNQLFLFSRARREGMRGDIGAIKDYREQGRTDEYVKKFFWYNTLPNLGRWAKRIAKIAGGGVAAKTGFDWLDEKIEQMEKTPEWMERGYNVIPLYTAPDGRAVNLTIAADDTGKIINNMIFEIVKQFDPKSRSDFMALIEDTAPLSPDTVSPQVKMATYLWDLAKGKNPTDNFYGRPSIDPTVFAAGGKDFWQAVFKDLVKMGGVQGIIPMQKEGAPDPETYIEQVQQIPVLGPILKRYIRITDQGISEELYKEAEEIKQAGAKEVLETRKVIRDDIKQRDEPATKYEQTKLYKQLKAEGQVPETLTASQFRARYKRAQAKSDRDPYLDPLAGRMRVNEKIQLLNSIADRVDPEKLTEILDQAVQEGSISTKTKRKFLKQRR